MRPLELACPIIYCLIVYNALAYVYFHLFNMSETARRIRILCEIDSVGSLTGEEIAAKYSTYDMLSVRIERLIAMRQLTRRGNRYLLKNPLFYYAALLITTWRHLLQPVVEEDV